MIHLMILGIETSCDETSVALLQGDGTVLVNLISSQIERHQPFGGVVPEIASREHLQHLFPLVARAMREAKVEWTSVDRIAVTAGPGLIGALLVGVAGAQGLSYGLGIPLVPVNHLEGHIFSPYLRPSGPATPIPRRFLSLVISGGHSSVYDVRDGSAEMLNRTRDDAIGETFDKVAKFMGLPYPGGPQIERAAAGGGEGRRRFVFTLPQFNERSADFSYSGVKAAAIRLARQYKISAAGDAQELADFCLAFQTALIDQLFDRLDRIWAGITPPFPQEVVVAGGVAANGVVRSRIAAWGQQRGVTVRLPEKSYCTDNAAMIAFAALQKPDAAVDPQRVTARSRLR